MKIESDGLLRAQGVELPEMLDALREAGAQFVALLRDLDRTEASNEVPGMTWTVGETAAHMLSILGRGTGDDRRADTLQGLAALNQTCVDEIVTRDPAELAEEIDGRLQRIVKGLSRWDTQAALDFPVPLHVGVVASLPSALSYILFDFLGHGCDIARATGQTWTIDADHAALCLHASIPLLTPWISEEVVAGPPRHFAFSFPGDDAALVIRVGGGSYGASNPGRSAELDAIEVDPVEMFLVIAGRTPAISEGPQSIANLFQPI